MTSIQRNYLSRIFGPRVRGISPIDACFGVYSQEPREGDFVLIGVTDDWEEAERLAAVVCDDLKAVFTIEVASQKKGEQYDDGSGPYMEANFPTVLPYGNSRLFKVEHAK